MERSRGGRDGRLVGEAGTYAGPVPDLPDPSDAPAMPDELETIVCADAEAWDAWLAANHERHEGVWLQIAKQGTGVPSPTNDEIVDVGLCWGWISGQRRSLDEHWYLQKYVPRRPRSRWSAVNVGKVAALLEAGRMRPPGLAEVAAAQADGRWDAAYVSQRHFTVPDDLKLALKASPSAAAAFEALGRSAQYGLVLRLITTLDAQARGRQLRRIVSQLPRA